MSGSMETARANPQDYPLRELERTVELEFKRDSSTNALIQHFCRPVRGR